uniref:Gastrin-releasing peptide n=1 Tax=Gallus gallus TaxID=9031 RepID=GRP_CHICK|nr:RecName: Full=Gastrin-releasing peptide; Short=GRP; AltName: Full=Proventricular peptide; Contains: RecName: Full=Neuromedin-C; AltName: Full=GRP-10; Flags: Precursor [Gallus gallus]
MGGGGPRRPGTLPLLALLALLAAHGGAAPLQPGGSPALTKIYPRGSHWAVGHLMGKKSTGDFPYAYEEENKIPLSASPENIKQLDDYLQREEMSKHLLQLLEGNENKSAHFSKGGLPWHTRNSWETDDSSSWKDVSRTRCVSAFLTVTFCSKVAYQLCPTSALS